MKYPNAFIYKMYDPIAPHNIFVGFSPKKDTLKYILETHKLMYESVKDNYDGPNKLIRYSIYKGKFDFNIEIIEQYPCENFEALKRRAEHHRQTQLANLNTFRYHIDDKDRRLYKTDQMQYKLMMQKNATKERRYRRAILREARQDLKI